MKPTNPSVLTINGGSSSIKFALFEAGDSLRRILEGGIERIGLPEATLRVKSLNQADNFSQAVTAPDHTVAVGVLMDWIEERSGRDALAAAGHRGLPCVTVRSAPATTFSGPAQRSLALWPARSRSRHATLYTEGSDSFVASAAASIATGWGKPVPGREFHPLKSSAFSRRTSTTAIPSSNYLIGLADGRRKRHLPRGGIQVFPNVLGLVLAFVS